MLEKILAVIDMQNDFIDGSLGTPEAVAIVDKVVEKIKAYECKNVYATRDTHFENYLETSEGKNLPVIHCVKNTLGWQINSKVADVLNGATILDKHSFGSLELAKILSKRSNTEDIEIEIIGLCTDICVINNAMLFKTYMPEVPINVDSSCCAGVTPTSHSKAIDIMKMCHINIQN